MLCITIKETKDSEYYNEATNEFIQKPGNKKTDLCLEHSLLSISKWESKWHKPFISKDERTQEEQIDYIRCMCITQNVDPLIFNNIDQDNIKLINDYINDKMTASTILDIKDNKGKREEKWITSELIYYWMIGLQIPFECEKWHLNRLLMLIRICDAKTKTNNKLSKSDTLRRQRALNEARKAKLHTKG